jgi:predicted nicotinamide N-methyase
MKSRCDGKDFSFCSKMTEQILEAYNIKLILPNEKSLKSAANPYWGKVWHSAIAMCDYLIKNNEILHTKTVMEMGAGLGLVSLVAANYASSVIATDISSTAVEQIKRAAQINQKSNLSAFVLDWSINNKLPNMDVLLLSDVNYDPSQFATLVQLIENCKKKNIKIILTTPQRLMAKPFIEKIQHLMLSNEEVKITFQAVTKYINIIII